MRERQARGLAPTPEEAVVRPHSAALGGRLLTTLDVMGSETGGRLLVVHDAFQPAGRSRANIHRWATSTLVSTRALSRGFLGRAGMTTAP